MKRQWQEFYKKRVNSTYQAYFNDKYSPMIDMILDTDATHVIDAGCGIGSVTKAIMGHKDTSGFDKCTYMVGLANNNVPNASSAFRMGDILTETDSRLTVTHGVLEHFQDDRIERILANFPNSIHYVPLDKYLTPSFGDERLLSAKHWIALAKPKRYQLFNNDHDLVFQI